MYILFKPVYSCLNSPTINFPQYLAIYLILTPTYTNFRLATQMIINPKIILAQKSIRHHGPDTWNYTERN